MMSPGREEMQKDGNETDKDRMDTKEFNTKCWGGERTGLGPEHRGVAIRSHPLDV